MRTPVQAFHVIFFSTRHQGLFDEIFLLIVRLAILQSLLNVEVVLYGILGSELTDGAHKRFEAELVSRVVSRVISELVIKADAMHFQVLGQGCLNNDRNDVVFNVDHSLTICFCSFWENNDWSSVSCVVLARQSTVAFS